MDNDKNTNLKKEDQKDNSKQKTQKDSVQIPSIDCYLPPLSEIGPIVAMRKQVGRNHDFVCTKQLKKEKRSDNNIQHGNRNSEDDGNRDYGN